MTEDNFVDYVSLNVISGNGGRGSSHLRREKFMAKGGPDGGDGGNGGDIIFRGDANIWTLYRFKFKKHFKAGHGGDGGRNKRTGKKGDNIIIKVPLGTTIIEKKSDKLLVEITENSNGEVEWVHYEGATKLVNVILDTGTRIFVRIHNHCQLLPGHRLKLSLDEAKSYAVFLS